MSSRDASGGRRDLGVALVGAGAAGAAARGLRLGAFDHRNGGRDGRRQHVERDTLALRLARAIAGAGTTLLALLAGRALRTELAVALGTELAARALGALAPLTTAAIAPGPVTLAVAAKLPFGALLAILALTILALTIWTILTLGPFRAIVALVSFVALVAVVAVGRVHRVVLILILVGIVIAALAALLLEAGAVLVEHAVIMLRELKEIFGLDAIALQLRVARERLVFLQELDGIAARAIVLAVVARVRALVRRAGSAAAAAPAATQTIVDKL
jgi:hypothetical protein